MGNTSHALVTHSPFDGIRQFKEDQEYWSARDLQALLGYALWQNFEKTIKKAMAACRNVGQNPEDHFIDINKMIKAGKGATREVKDYHLTRFACYLTAMNGDPDKPEIAQAQTSFAIKTREAEVGLQAAPPIHTISDGLRERALLNIGRIPDRYFAMIGEAFKALYNLESILNRNLDNMAEIEKSLGQCWSPYARDVLHIPEAERRTYQHVCVDRKVCSAWAYPSEYLPAFEKWLWLVYIPEKFPAYARSRARRIGAPVPQIAAPKKLVITNGADQLQLF